MTRHTTLREIRDALQAWGRDHPRDYVSRNLYADKELIPAHDDAATVEDLKLFGKRICGGPRPKRSLEELKKIVLNSRIPRVGGGGAGLGALTAINDADEEVEEVDMDRAL